MEEEAMGTILTIFFVIQWKGICVLRNLQALRTFFLRRRGSDDNGRDKARPLILFYFFWEIYTNIVYLRNIF